VVSYAMKYFESALEILKRLWKKPKSVFEDAQKQKSLKPAIYFYLVVVFASSIFQSLSDLFLQPKFTQLLAGIFGVPYNLPQITIDIALFHIVVTTISMVLLVGPIYALILTLVIHLWAKLWRGKGNFKDSLKLLIFSISPTFLLSFLPLLSIFGFLYSGYLYIVGSQVLHKFTKRKALLVFGVPLLLILVFTILGVWFNISSLQAGSRG